MLQQETARGIEQTDELAEFIEREGYDPTSIAVYCSDCKFYDPTFYECIKLHDKISNVDAHDCCPCHCYQPKNN